MQLLKAVGHRESLSGPEGDPYSGEPEMCRIRKPGENWTRLRPLRRAGPAPSELSRSLTGAYPESEWFWYRGLGGPKGYRPRRVGDRWPPGAREFILPGLAFRCWAV